jgi:membrane-associated protein
MLSLVFIVPRYVSGEVTGGFVSLFRHALRSEPEWELVISFVSPFVWVFIPLSSIILGIMCALAYNISFRTKALNEIIHAGALMLLAIGLVPALLTVRELLLYEQVHIFGDFSIAFNSLNILARLTRNLLDPTAIATWGSLAVAVVIFVETGLFFGFFLPGDSLLVTIGILASTGRVDLRQVIPLAALAAIAGDQVNYFIGQCSGDALSRRYSFVAKHMDQARSFYHRHGGKAIVIARFIPVIRTFAPAAAGAAGMRYRSFLVANVVGGLTWVIGATIAGFILGRILPVTLVSNLALIAAIVVSISLLPPLFASVRGKLRRGEQRH